MVIFFVLSGYVIALSYSSWEWGRRPLFCLTRFFFYRFARLYPAFLLFAILILLRTPSLLLPVDGDKLGLVIPHLLLWQSWLPVKFNGALADGGPFHVSWSLSTECALYLFFGIGAILAARVSTRPYGTIVLFSVLTAAILGALAFLWTARSYFSPVGWSKEEWYRWLFYVSPYSVSVEFLMGVAAYRLTQSMPLLSTRVAPLASLVGAGSLIALYLLNVYGVIELWHYGYYLLAALSVASVLVGTTAGGLVNQFLASRALISLGTISYSLYLFHAVAPGAVVGGDFSKFEGPVPTIYLLNFSVSLLLAVAIAAGIYRLLELPARKRVRVLADRLLGVQSTTPIAPLHAPQSSGTAGS
jgi:peptidoglycan/LPS O-acetylase OafA/YrhL